MDCRGHKWPRNDNPAKVLAGLIYPSIANKGFGILSERVGFVSKKKAEEIILGPHRP